MGGGGALLSVGHGNFVACVASTMNTMNPVMHRLLLSIMSVSEPSWGGEGYFVVCIGVILCCLKR